MSTKGLARVALIGLLSVCLACSGCTTLRDVPLPPKLSPDTLPDVHRGDRVEVVLKNGERGKFKVTEVTEQAILGDYSRVVWTDIEELRVVGRSRDGTIFLIVVGGVVVTVAVVVIVEYVVRLLAYGLFYYLLGGAGGD